MPRYFEDIEVGESYEHGTRTVTRDEIVEFAEQYDPQPFHVDEDAAEASVMGGLAASGWHTAAVCMRLLVEVMDEADWVSQGARGVDALRWIQPVRPGDELSVEFEVVDKRLDDDRPALGEVDSRMTGYNQDGDAVITWVGLGLVKRRDGAG
jgi:acyl dehydratase